MNRVLKNMRETIDVTFEQGDADAPGTVTYAVTDQAGASVQSGTATNATSPAGYYSFLLAPQTAVKQLTVVWSGTWGAVAQTQTTYAEVVGAHLFTIPEARAFDDAKLADASSYTDATIRDARAGITDFFEEITGVSFVPRYGSAIVDGSDYDLWLPHRQVRTLLAGSVDGTALTAQEILDTEVYESGRLYRTVYWGGSSYPNRRNVTVSYEHGYLTPPWDIKQAALVYLRYLLVSSDISDRTVSWSNELGTFRQAVPGRQYPTGIPTVDAALSRYMPGMVLA